MIPVSSQDIKKEVVEVFRVNDVALGVLAIGKKASEQYVGGYYRRRLE